MQMTVNRLIDELTELQKQGYGHHPVFVVNDDKGNGVHAIAYASQVGFVPHGSWDTDQYAYYEFELASGNVGEIDEIVIVG